MVIIALENIAMQLDKKDKRMYTKLFYYPALSQELDNFNYILDL